MIPEKIKQRVIRLWLEGNSRKEIALITGISEGTVSNIIADLRQKIGDRDAEALRELGINMKRIGIDATQCAQGLRILNTMRKLGVNQNQVESFMIEVYEYCQRIGLPPQDIASNLQALINLSKDIPFSKIPEYIEEKKKEKTKLGEDIKTLKERKETSEMETSLSKELRDLALQEEKTTTAELREYSNLKAELRRYGLDIHKDIPKFAKVVNSISNYGYDVDQVLSIFEDLESLKFLSEYLSNRVNQLFNQKMGLEEHCSTLQDMAISHSQKLYACDELKSMGLGFNKLRLLINTIKEIAAEKQIPYKVAIEKFFESLEQKYEIKLRQNMQEEKQQLQKNNNDRPNNPNRTFPYYRNNTPSTALPKPSASLEKQRQQEQRHHQQQMPWPSSISYTYRKTTTVIPKTTKEEQNNQLNNNYQPDEWYESDDDGNSL
jgi:Helix-turn-helix domain